MLSDDGSVVFVVFDFDRCAWHHGDIERREFVALYSGVAMESLGLSLGSIGGSVGWRGKRSVST